MAYPLALMAPSVGFEPTCVSANGFQNRRLKPLDQLGMCEMPPGYPLQLRAALSFSVRCPALSHIIRARPGHWRCQLDSNQRPSRIYSAPLMPLSYDSIKPWYSFRATASRSAFFPPPPVSGGDTRMKAAVSFKNPAPDEGPPGSTTCGRDYSSTARIMRRGNAPTVHDRNIS